MASSSLEGQQYALTSQFSKIKGQSMVFVKLTDSALKAIEDYAAAISKGNVSPSFKPSIEFRPNNSQGVISIPTKVNGGTGSSSSSGGELTEKQSYNFSLKDVQNDGSVQEAVQQNRREMSMDSLGKILLRMQIHANDDSFQNTKVRMAQAEEAMKKNNTKVIQSGDPNVGRKVKVKRPAGAFGGAFGGNSSSANKGSSHLHQSHPTGGFSGSSSSSGAAFSSSSTLASTAAASSSSASSSSLATAAAAPSSSNMYHKKSPSMPTTSSLLTSMPRFGGSKFSTTGSSSGPSASSSTSSLNSSSLLAAGGSKQTVSPPAPVPMETTMKRPPVLSPSPPTSDNNQQQQPSPPAPPGLLSLTSHLSHHQQQQNQQNYRLQPHNKPGNNHVSPQSNSSSSSSGSDYRPRHSSAGAGGGSGQQQQSSLKRGVIAAGSGNGGNGGNGNHHHPQLEDGRGYTSSISAANGLKKFKAAGSNGHNLSSISSSSSNSNGINGSKTTASFGLGADGKSSSTTTSASHNGGTSSSSSSHNGGNGNSSSSQHQQQQLPPFSGKYTRIQSADQLAAYRADFNAEFPEYRRLFEYVDAVSREFDRLRDLVFSKLDEESDEWQDAVRTTIGKYEELKKNDSRYARAQKRLQYLHNKLTHIKNLILEYVQRVGASTNGGAPGGGGGTGAGASSHEMPRLLGVGAGDRHISF